MQDKANLYRAGNFYWMRDILEHQNTLVGKKICTVGLASKVDFERGRVTLSFENSNIKLDTTKSTVNPIKLNALYNVIGTVEVSVDDGLIIHAQSLRDVSGLDLTMWKDACKIRQKFYSIYIPDTGTSSFLSQNSGS